MSDVIDINKYLLKENLGDFHWVEPANIDENLVGIWQLMEALGYKIRNDVSGLFVNSIVNIRGNSEALYEFVMFVASNSQIAKDVKELKIKIIEYLKISNENSIQDMLQNITMNLAIKVFFTILDNYQIVIDALNLWKEKYKEAKKSIYNWVSQYFFESCVDDGLKSLIDKAQETPLKLADIQPLLQV